MDSLNWDGPTFLTLFMLCEFTAIIAAYFYRDYARDLPGSVEMPELTAYELAYLAGGIPALCEAATVKLIHAGCLQANYSMRRLTRTDVPPAGLDDVERAVFESADSVNESKTRGESGRAISRSQQYVASIAKVIRTKLQQHNLMMDEAKQARVQLITFTIVASPIILGVLKVAVGIARGKPVAFLIILLVISFFTAVFSAFVLPVARTKLGDGVLHNMRKKMETLKLSALRGANLPPHDLALGVALFGAAALSEYSTVTDWNQLKRLSGSSCGSGSCAGGSCGGGGCGGGCGGCGGCGG